MKREQAKSQGLKRYNTGKPCKKGHIADRYVSNGRCDECMKAAAAIARADPVRGQRIREKKNARERERLRKEEVKLRRSEVKKAARNEPSERARQLAVNAEWRRENRARVNAAKAARRAAELLAMPEWVDKGHIRAVYESCPHGSQVDHIVPLRGVTPDGAKVSGLHVPWNLRHLPAAQNMSRCNRISKEDLQMIETAQPAM